MKVSFTLIGGILAAATFFIFLFEIAVLMDSAIYIYFK
jgi:hypothetical protein